MTEDLTVWMQRANEILAKPAEEDVQGATRTVHFALSMLTALYGPTSPQLQEFRTNQVVASKLAYQYYNMALAALGAIENAKQELEAGLVTSARVLVAGELLAEMVRVAKDVLIERTEEATNVASVLVASAFEALMRRMGEDFAGVNGRPKLEEVISALKVADVLRGGQVGTALSYLQFRNDALHADWNRVDRSQVESCLAFVESLLNKHFA